MRIFFYLNDQERKLESATDKMMLALTNFAAEFEREKASQRTHDAMCGKPSRCMLPEIRCLSMTMYPSYVKNQIQMAR